MNESLAFPDFVPTDMLAEHLDAARAQVAARRLPPTQAPMRVARPPVAPAQPLAVAPARSTAGPWATSRHLHVPLAAVLALMGVMVLTCLWAWLASTHDPVWWWFTAIGGTLTACTAGWLLTLEERGRSKEARQGGLEPPSGHSAHQ